MQHKVKYLFKSSWTWIAINALGLQSCHKKKKIDKVFTHCDEIEHTPVTVCSWLFVTIALKGQRSFKRAKHFVLQKIWLKQNAHKKARFRKYLDNSCSQINGQLCSEITNLALSVIFRIGLLMWIYGFELYFNLLIRIFV